MQYVEQRARAERSKRDQGLLDEYAAALNREMADILDYQALP
jgi:hypothetical protein